MRSVEAKYGLKHIVDVAVDAGGKLQRERLQNGMAPLIKKFQL
jgi:hypothetical protein